MQEILIKFRKKFTLRLFRGKIDLWFYINSLLAFLILTPIFAFIIHRFFSLKYLGLNFADLTFPLYFIEVIAISARFFTHSFLPYITILLSLAAIIITIQMLRKTQSFKFKRFLKFFWRISFFITSIFYLGTVILIFIVS